eukprot:CCRYP_019743-RB/>CCRYP_019743-RB protein AED:0.33 eAED:1.00 QI:0/-1/0/1/-1/0/1/0/55
MMICVFKPLHWLHHRRPPRHTYWTLGRYKFVCHPYQEGHHHAKRYATLPANLKGI